MTWTVVLFIRKIRYVTNDEMVVCVEESEKNGFRKK